MVPITGLLAAYFTVIVMYKYLCGVMCIHKSLNFALHFDCVSAFNRWKILC